MGCGGSKEPPTEHTEAKTTATANEPKGPSDSSSVINGSGRGAEFAADICARPTAAQLQSTELLLAENELVELPATISVFSALIKLDLSQNHLTALPSSICSLVSLQVLDVNDNQLKSLPDEIGSLTALETLLVYKNALTALPESLSGLQSLQEINCFNNKILKLPPALGQLAAAEEVNLSANKVMKVDAGAIASWTSVKVLNFYDCRILQLASLAHMQALKELRLFGNQLREMPELGSSMPHLTILEVSRNQISSIPDTFFGGLPQLSYLRISGNKLTSLPASVGSTALETLLVDDNALTELPGELAAMSTIKVLLINGNALTSLPSEFGANPTITRINLKGNPIQGCAETLVALQSACNKNDGVFVGP